MFTQVGHTPAPGTSPGLVSASSPPFASALLPLSRNDKPGTQVSVVKTDGTAVTVQLQAETPTGTPEKIQFTTPEGVDHTLRQLLSLQKKLIGFSGAVDKTLTFKLDRLNILTLEEYLKDIETIQKRRSFIEKIAPLQIRLLQNYITYLRGICDELARNLAKEVEKISDKMNERTINREESPPLSSSPAYTSSLIPTVSTKAENILPKQINEGWEILTSLSEMRERLETLKKRFAFVAKEEEYRGNRFIQACIRIAIQRFNKDFEPLRDKKFTPPQLKDHWQKTELSNLTQKIGDLQKQIKKDIEEFETINRAENLFCAAETALKEQGDDVTLQDTTKINASLDNLRDAISSRKVVDITACMDKVVEATQKLTITTQGEQDYLDKVAGIINQFEVESNLHPKIEKFRQIAVAIAKLWMIVQSEETFEHLRGDVRLTIHKERVNQLNNLRREVLSLEVDKLQKEITDLMVQASDSSQAIEDLLGSVSVDLKTFDEKKKEIEEEGKQRNLIETS